MTSHSLIFILPSIPLIPFAYAVSRFLVARTGVAVIVVMMLYARCERKKTHKDIFCVLLGSIFLFYIDRMEYG